MTSETTIEIDTSTAVARLTYWYSLSEAAEKVGVSRSCIISWKKGQTKPKGYALTRVLHLIKSFPAQGWEQALDWLLRHYEGKAIADQLDLDFRQLSRWECRQRNPYPASRRKILALARGYGYEL
ncbi:MAG: hypothetical protein AAFX78_01830 [Cyanobacteria bacterium J06638_20]